MMDISSVCLCLCLSVSESLCVSVSESLCIFVSGLFDRLSGAARRTSHS